MSVAESEMKVSMVRVFIIFTSMFSVPWYFPAVAPRRRDTPLSEKAKISHLQRIREHDIDTET